MSYPEVTPRRRSYRFSLYDSILVATALISGAKILYSEDLQHGQIIDNQLRVTNPF
jgi:predicted nucleic acid-binding protein